MQSTRLEDTRDTVCDPGGCDLNHFMQIYNNNNSFYSSESLSVATLLQKARISLPRILLVTNMAKYSFSSLYWSTKSKLRITRGFAARARTRLYYYVVLISPTMVYTFALLWSRRLPYYGVHIPTTMVYTLALLCCTHSPYYGVNVCPTVV